MVLKFIETYGEIKKYVALNDKDWLTVNDGDKGSGKSNVSILACLENCPKFNIDNITYTIKDLGKQIRKDDDYHFQLLDEPTDILARTPTGKGNLEFIKTLITARERHQIVFINTQHLKILDWVARDFANSIIQTFYITDLNTLKDTYFYSFYNRKRVKKITFEARTHRAIYPSPNWTEVVNKFFKAKWPKFFEEYREKKNNLSYIKKIVDKSTQYKNFKDLFEPKKEFWTTANNQQKRNLKVKIAKELNVEIRDVEKLIDKSIVE